MRPHRRRPGAQARRHQLHARQPQQGREEVAVRRRHLRRGALRGLGQHGGRVAGPRHGRQGDAPHGLWGGRRTRGWRSGVDVQIAWRHALALRAAATARVSGRRRQRPRKRGGGAAVQNLCQRRGLHRLRRSATLAWRSTRRSSRPSRLSAEGRLRQFRCLRREPRGAEIGGDCSRCRPTRTSAPSTSSMRKTPRCARCSGRSLRPTFALDETPRSSLVGQAHPGALAGAQRALVFDAAARRQGSKCRKRSQGADSRAPRYQERGHGLVPSRRATRSMPKTRSTRKSTRTRRRRGRAAEQGRYPGASSDPRATRAL